MNPALEPMYKALQSMQELIGQERALLEGREPSRLDAIRVAKTRLIEQLAPLPRMLAAGATSIDTASRNMLLALLRDCETGNRANGHRLNLLLSRAQHAGSTLGAMPGAYDRKGHMRGRYSGSNLTSA